MTKKLKLAESYVLVTDMDRAIKFYEKLLGVKTRLRYKNRWASVLKQFGLYNLSFDKKHNIDMTNIEGDIKRGNNSIIVFHSSDIEYDYQRIKKMDITMLSNIAEINLIAHYKFFHFKDPDGNIIEIGQYL